MAQPRISIIGLGYVGLPLAVALARHFAVVGFDVNAERIAELRRGSDRTGEVPAAELAQTKLRLTGDAADMRGSDVYIVTVPTPVDSANRPDLAAVRGACETVGRHIGKGAIVVLESTVYPGVTEEVCGPIVERASGLVCGRDFFLGYSPERINPGDRQHTVDRITKVVAGQTPAVASTLADVYGRITSGGAFVARSIRTAEAAKVIENAQRDINIAFINEVTIIFNRLGLSVHDVLAAAGTKWNFLPFTPGLVGGHCIGVDPYYLADRAIRSGYDPEVILAGRRINDRMGHYVAEQISAQLDALGKAVGRRILVLGLTFKENVPDIRNSKVVDIVRYFESRGDTADVHDPLADPREAKAEYGVTLCTEFDERPYDAVIGAVAHDQYRALSPAMLQRLVRPGGVLADVKGIWRHVQLPPDRHRWSL